MRYLNIFFFFSSRRRHTRLTCDWSSDVCSSDLEPEGIGSVRAGLHLRRVEERQKRRLPGLPISDDYDVRHGLPVRGAPRRRVVLILWKCLLEPSNRDRSGEGSGLVALRPKGFVTEFLPGDVRINVTLKRQVFSSARAIRVPR